MKTTQTEAKPAVGGKTLTREQVVSMFTVDRDAVLAILDERQRLRDDLDAACLALGKLVERCDAMVSDAGLTPSGKVWVETEVEKARAILAAIEGGK